MIVLACGATALPLPLSWCNTSDMKTLDEMIEEEAAKQAAETDAWLEKNKERLVAKAATERARHIALGWLQEDGSLPLAGDDNVEDDDDAPRG
jgi:hypothetical protein